MTRTVLTFLIAIVLPAAAAAQQTPPSEPAKPAPAPYKISVMVFGDYYAFPQHHLAEWEGQHGLWLRRIYFTYDHTFSPALSARFRLEANSNGKLAGGTLEPYVKDAYIRWTFTGRQRLIAGIQPSLTFESVESVWGLRHIEKTPLDLYKVDSSRETGFTVSGPINDSGTIAYAAQFGNGSGNASETDKRKGYRLSAGYATDPGFSIEGMFGRAERAGDADRTTMQVFGGYRGERLRAGALYARQTRRAAAGSTAPDLDLDIVSGFGVFDLAGDRASAFVRVDRYNDPCPDCAGIDYLPIATTDPFTMTLAGVEYRLHPSVRVSPNVEWVKYAGGSAAPGDDVAARLTFFWTW